MQRGAVKEMRRTLGKIVAIDPARADQRPIDMVLDHPLEGPGLRALRAHRTSRPCAKAHIAVNERHASSIIAQRRSDVTQWMETSCSNANPWAFTRGPRLPRKP